MKKSFPFHVAGKDDARVLEAIKNDVRKYVKRERRKPVKTGVDFWDFDCRVGADEATAVVTHIAVVTEAIDAIARAEGATAVFVEIHAKPGVRTKKPVPVDPAAAALIAPLAATAVADAPEVGPETPSADGYIAPSEAFDADGSGEPL